jgi:hypothetical protein
MTIKLLVQDLIVDAATTILSQAYGMDSTLDEDDRSA